MLEAQPSRTALHVALRRAAHQAVDAKPLIFSDPFARPILGRAAAEGIGRTPSAARKPFSAALRAWVVARVRYAEDTLAHAAATHDKVQYLLLGAGLDTFALRNPFSNVRVFEVDHPATQAWKRECLAEASLPWPQTARLVPVDFERQSLSSELTAAGFRLDLPTVVAWLGVVPYLSEGAFAATSCFLGTLAQGSAVVFDYTQPRAVLPPTEQLMHDSLAARVAQAGEPFQLFFTPFTLAAALRPCGLRILEDLDSAGLNRRYFAGRTDGLAVRGAAGRLCHAAVVAQAAS